MSGLENYDASEVLRMSTSDRITLRMKAFDDAYEAIAEYIDVSPPPRTLHVEVEHLFTAAIQRWNELCEDIGILRRDVFQGGGMKEFIDAYVEKYETLRILTLRYHVGVFPREFPVDEYAIDFESTDRIINEVRTRLAI
ncbi:hypothetical protein A2881_00520 [Candidatus Peribacteria bacterium RIFCSPHIGHO2_01_FULL_55_13]|nr:MAG: hypothetical protein A2881_00520 [Candidatus Peribacteria bacterium RIFCSPHIGHO2_01_FULL_55_13]OGJ66179.1 MAG: hypothetical protein A3F36_05735 [Candidatus Peribacteria bacterium RIFCSPHIGHO2_12_FULL_55_11]